MFKRYLYSEGLTNLRGSGGKYLINIDGQVKDIKGNDLPVSLDEDGHKTVFCKSWDDERVYRVIDLVAIQYKNLYIPEEDFNKVIAFCIDGNKDNTHAANIGYRFKGGKIQLKGCPGFYYVPSYTSVCINIDGEIVSSRNMKPLKWGVSRPNYARNIKGGYYVSSVLISRGIQRPMSRHRAMMLTFKEYPDNVDALTVNHIDGIPGNDTIDNLEWLSYSANNEHARQNNMRSQNIAVLVRNVKTGEVKEYISLGDCARALGLSGAEAVRFRIANSRFGTVFRGDIQMKLKSDPRDWINPEDVPKGAQTFDFIAKNILTNEEYHFTKIEDVASLIPDYHPRFIVSRLNMRVFDIYKGYQFKNTDDERPFPLLSSKEIEEHHPVGGYSVEARNILTGETKTYATIRQASKDFNSYLAIALRDGIQPTYDDGWQVKYAKDQWNTTEDLDATMYKSQKNVMALHIETGKVILAESITAMSRVLKIDYKDVEEGAYSRGNKICHGFRVRLGITSHPWPDTQLHVK